MSFEGAFALPFSIGCAVMFAVIGYKFVRWIYILPDSDKRLICRNILSRRSWQAVGECVGEALLHRRIFRVNPLLGYMHASLAVGWFLLIVAGAVEVILYLDWTPAPLRGHVFFRYYAREFPHTEPWQVAMANVMDGLLAVVLSGVVLAWSKRAYSRMMGMHRTTRHIVGDRVALAALWCVFPARLLAESVTAALWHNGGFLTEAVGGALASVVPLGALLRLEGLAWLFYALSLGVFFCAMPFSRYMHIFTEIPLIFLRRWGVRSDERPKSFDHFQIEACSRCGLCIDVCQLGRDAKVD
ncbi:MAG: (Fe-S)-binding protein, partial [Rikenellaceae bacterium]|nr:(Fe-S)-binding protein [Rikenellaceae bacterium]